MYNFNPNYAKRKALYRTERVVGTCTFYSIFLYCLYFYNEHVSFVTYK